MLVLKGATEKLFEEDNNFFQHVIGEDFSYKIT